MNLANAIQMPEAPTQASSDSELVAIAFVRFIEDFNTVTFWLAQSLFRDERITSQTIGKPGGFFRPGFMTFTFRVLERNAALQALHAIAQENPYVAGWHELAYFDKDEGYWRTVFPPGSTAFETRFMDPEELRAYGRAMEERAALTRTILEKLEQRNQKRLEL